MGTGRAPADLHPQLNKTKVAKALVEDRNPGQRSEGPFSRREEGWEQGEEKSNKRKREKERKRESINNENKKARRPKSTGFNETNNHKDLISKQQGRQ